MNSNISLFKRLEHAQLQLAALSAPNTPLVEYDCPPIDLTKLLGDTARAQLARSARKDYHA